MKTLLLAALLAFPTLASAQNFVLDTGLPAGTGGPLVLNSAQSLGAEFSASAGTSLTELSFYLTKGTPDTFFTASIYSGDAGLPSNSNRSATPLKSVTGTFTADGWNATAFSLTLPTTGDYWVTIASSSGSSFDAPLETGLGTGSVPALSFAFSNSTGKYTVSNTATSAFGVEVTAAAAPEPSSWALALVCTGLFIALRRRFARA